MILTNRKKQNTCNLDDVGDPVQFDEGTHTYTHKGEKCPSVTQVLPELPEHLIYNQNFIEKTELGSRVHKATEIFDRFGYKSISKKFLRNCKSTLGMPLKDEDIPYIEGWIKFMKESGWKNEEIEMLCFSQKYNYAGMCDRVGRHPKIFKRKKTILDIKTVSKVSPTVALQTAGYLNAYNEEWPNSPCEGRLAIQLLPEGDYKVHRYEIENLPYDLNVFLSKVISKRWDLENLTEE